MSRCNFFEAPYMNPDDYDTLTDLINDWDEEAREKTKQRNVSQIMAQHAAMMQAMNAMQVGSKQSAVTQSAPAPAPKPETTIITYKRLTLDEMKLLPDKLRVALLRHRVRVTGCAQKKLMEQLEECCNGFYYLRMVDEAAHIAFETKEDQTKFMLAIKL
jgi:hypothetical protein